MAISSIAPLPAQTLYTACDPEQFSFATTAELAEIDAIIGQPRAEEALRFGIRIKAEGYNIFALGPVGTGKIAMVRQIISQEAAGQPLPADWCYINNFSQPHKPKALPLPAGQGRQFQTDMEQVIEEIRIAIPAVFGSETYRSRIEALNQELEQRQHEPINELREEARQRHIAFIETPTGYAFAPMNQNNEVISPEQFETLPKEKQEEIQETVEKLQQKLQKILYQFPQWRKETKNKIHALNKEVTEFAVKHMLETMKTKYHDFPVISTYLDDVQMDLIAHTDEFLQAPENHPLKALMPQDGFFQRYKVNLLIDHADDRQVPVEYEALPNHANLIGRSEYQAHMGTLFTDFTMIKPGAFHRANGGYLILEAQKLLLQPYAWEGLKRTLKARSIQIEPLERTIGLMNTATLEPEPIPLSIKVILTGDQLLYYLLEHYDPEFADLFKVAADFDETMQRTTDSQLLYARQLATMARQNQLRPLTREAVARVIEYSARLANDAEKLSTHLRTQADLLREANYWAGQNGMTTIEAAHVQQAIDQQIYRADRLREHIYEEIARGTLLIDTDNEVIGQVNALSVLQLGNFAFAKPSRVTASTRLGGGEVLDIERETELGGAIHSKGVMILSNFLAARFASDYPLSMSASLVFEQSYGGIEGDSASLAELCALLSSLAQLPIRQSLAITGSVNQHGQVQAIGGVNEKIEGFFDVCKQLGLSGKQGVIIPAANMKHLMLRRDVIAAVKDQQFAVYAVNTVDEAVELLTAYPAGARDNNGLFPENSINGMVDQRLREFAELRQRFGDEEHAEKGKSGHGSKATHDRRRR